MAAVFALGAAASAGYFYSVTAKPPPAAVQAAAPAPQPIVIQLVQPPAQAASAGAVVPVQGATAGAGGVADSTEWVLVGPPAPDQVVASPTLLRPVEVTVVPQALTQGVDSGSTPAAPRPKRADSPAAASGVKINLNTATQAELESLPQVGPSMAKRIMEYRAANGPFRSVKDLDKVKGIGEKTLAKLTPLVTVDAAVPER